MVITQVTKQSMFPFLIFNKAFPYNNFITLHPVKMKDIMIFQQYQMALMLRKDSIFREKHIVKMPYLDFIKYACRNTELAQDYNLPLLPFYYDFIIGMLQIVCRDTAQVTYNSSTLDLSINGFQVTNDVFDDLRKIIILQNDIDFDIDDFTNIDTIRALEKAREFEQKKNDETADIEDYIDSLVITMNVTEEYVSNMTIRKFWRYIKRINKHDEYEACRAGQMSGMVTFKEPLKHWMTSLEVTDKYKDLKTDENELRSKIE